MTQPRYLRAIQVAADKEIVERFRGGFVGRFDREVLWLTLAYEAYLQRRVPTQGIPKLFLTWTDRPVEPTHKPFAPMAMRRQFPFDEYRAAEQAAKKLLLLNHLHAHLLDTAAQYGWDAAPFEEARDRLIQSDLMPRLAARKTYRHPHRRVKARLACELDLEEFRIFGELVDLKSRPLGKAILAGTAIPIHDLFGGYLKDAHWGTDDTFQVGGSSFQRITFPINFATQIEQVRCTVAESPIEPR